MKSLRILRLCAALLSLTIIYSCKISGPGGLFAKLSPHEKYSQLLSNSGLHTTALGKQWLLAAENSLNNPLQVTIPYKEQGYFPADKARAGSLRFEAKQGQKVMISFSKRPQENFMVYIDLWEERRGNRKLVAYADTAKAGFDYEIEKSGTYLLRIQPELLVSGEYTLTITAGPSLAFPVRKGKAQSFWGATRDAGARQHEGVDIFAPFRTPVLAASNGTVTRVTLNTLGGKVVFMRPEGKSYNLYYAHLDEQLAAEGQTVATGDTLGLVGTTGNAKGGPPHLHFGIYTSGGAVDPFPFIDTEVKQPSDIKVAAAGLGKSMRTFHNNTILHSAPGTASAPLIQLPAGSLVEIVAATSTWFRILLPDGTGGFIKGSDLKNTGDPLGQITLTANLPLLDRPDTSAARKNSFLPATSSLCSDDFRVSPS